MSRKPLHFDFKKAPYQVLIGTGGIGYGMFFKLIGNHDIGRTESRASELLNINDYCKLQIIIHYPATLLGANLKGESFKVFAIGKAGNDVSGEKCIKEMNEAGINTTYVQTIDESSTTMSVCWQYPNGDGGNFTTVNSASNIVTPDDVYKAENIFKQYHGKGIALAAPEVPLEARESLLELGTKYKFFRAASFTREEAKDVLDSGVLKLVDLIGVNKEEAAALAGISYDEEHPEELVKACGKVLNKFNPNMQISITLGEKGSYGYEKGRIEYTPASTVKHINTAGAGDAHLGALITARAAGLPFINETLGERTSPKELTTAMDFAGLLASLKVMSPHSINMEVDSTTLYQHSKEIAVSLSPQMDSLLNE